MADTDYYIRTGEVHLKEGKVKKLLLESSTVNKTWRSSAVCCNTLPWRPKRDVSGSYCMTFYGICGVYVNSRHTLEMDTMNALDTVGKSVTVQMEWPAIVHEMRSSWQIVQEDISIDCVHMWQCSERAYQDIVMWSAVCRHIVVCGTLLHVPLVTWHYTTQFLLAHKYHSLVRRSQRSPS